MNGKKYPEKYKKHKALVLLGFKTQEELDSDLGRFDVSEVDKLSDEVRQSLQTDRIPTSYLISLIPRYSIFKLPNLVVRTEDDLARLQELIAKNPDTVELWRFRKENEGIIGRFSISSDPIKDSLEYQRLEQVWSNSHRSLENYDPNGGVPYISGKRNGWHRPYKIDRIQNITRDDNRLNSYFESAKEIERSREKIEGFYELCSGIGIGSASVEYSIDSKGFHFIDFDTSNDKRLLNELFPERVVEERDE